MQTEIGGNLEKMSALAASRFHWLLGTRRPRLSYRKDDFLDYAIMVLAAALVIRLAYRDAPLIAWPALALCAYMIGAFALRHGMRIVMPALLRRPQDILHALLYKLENLPDVYWISLVVLLLGNFLISVTPGWPHHISLMRGVALGLFFCHLALILAYRTRSLVDHLRKRKIVRDVLLDSPWKNVGLVGRNLTFEILHAYFTGILTHILLLAPWYFVITHAQFSVLFAPLALAIDYGLQRRFLRQLNAWFYRDHWLGHNSELEFIYLHGSHHDAIPSGLMAVAGNGLLEGVLRNVLGFPTPFYSPIMAFIAYTVEVRRDIAFHQFIPGIYPRLRREFRRVGQHSTHHFGRLEPYGFGIKLDQAGFSEPFKQLFKGLPEEFSNSIRLDEALTGFKWDNIRYRWFLNVCNKYES